MRVQRSKNCTTFSWIVAATYHSQGHSKGNDRAFSISNPYVVIQSCLEAIVGTLWMLAEADVESLKVLQTILLLVTITEIVSGQDLAKVSS